MISEDRHEQGGERFMTRCLNGMVNVGDTVVSIPCEEFGGLIGVVTKISAVGTDDHETENTTDDIYVDFRNDYGRKRRKEILQEYRELFRDQSKTWEEIGLDMIIMAPDMLLKLDVDSLAQDFYKQMLCSHIAISNWCMDQILKAKRIEVESSLGRIFAEVGGNSDYPGIYLGIVGNGEEIERTYALAETIKSGEQYELHLVVWSTDDYGDPDYVHPIIIDA